ncbi:ESX secretion-associated protein EspG [Parasphingorhabdus pacifica]
MRPGSEGEPTVLSTLEFDVVCSAEKLTAHRHVVLDVPSPGATHSERAELEADVWSRLRTRQLAEAHRDRVDVDLGDLLALLDRPQRTIDARIWADRPIRALASANGGDGLLTIVDGDIVELTPIRASSLAEAAVSVAGHGPAGDGRQVSVPNDVLREAGDRAGPHDRQLFVDELRALGVTLDDAAVLARMADGMGMRGQFGAQSARARGGTPERAGRVVAFHDNPSGRYLHAVRPSGDGRRWSTIAPADNPRIADYVRELLTEVTEQ